jgi:hypothetical protein
MSHDGRASSASVPEITVVEPEDRDGVCAAGSPLTLAQQDREALRRLCEVGRMIRRTDGNYGTPRERLITMAVARRGLQQSRHSVQRRDLPNMRMRTPSPSRSRSTMSPRSRRIIPDDPDAFDLEDCSIYAEREDDITDLIEEEFCFVGPIHATPISTERTTATSAGRRIRRSVAMGVGRYEHATEIAFEGWQTANPHGQHLRHRMHVLGSERRVIGQALSETVNGARSTDLWKPAGDRRHDLPPVPHQTT